MAGSNLFSKSSQQNNFHNLANHSEIIEDSHSSSFNKSSGILQPGGSIEFNYQPKPQPEKPRFIDYIGKEQALLINHDEKKDQQEIQNIQKEISSLNSSNENLNKDVSNIPLQEIPEVNIYQANFFQRIKAYIIDFKKDSSNSNSWAEFYNHRKGKRNAFWNRSKSGGQKYRDSGEHNPSRSAN